MNRRLEYRIQPIDVWPGEQTPDWKRTRSQFKTIWTKVLAHLTREVYQLGGRNVVLRLDVADRDVRQDGLLRADARPRSPGVIVEFSAGRLKGDPRLLYRCDRFRFWQDNVSAIARGLEALRMVDRYGITKVGEQYAGFKALPASTAPTMTAEAAATTLAMRSAFTEEEILRSADCAKQAARRARMLAHPDTNNGDQSAWDMVEAARSVLSSHHGVSL